MATTINISNIILDNDLSGTLDNPYVVSVSNVKFGTLSVENGGLGLYSLPYGQLLLGNGVLSPKFLSGSDGDFLSWSDISGSWISKKTDNIKSLNFSLDQNSLFTLLDFSTGSTKSYSIINNQYDPGLFLATPTSSYGTASFRSLENADIPQILNNKNLSNSKLEGQFTGSATVDSISGDGAGLYNISSSQIIDFYPRVQNILYDQDLVYNNINILTGNIGYAVIVSGTIAGEISGTFLGDGSGIENISISSIPGIYSYINNFFTGGNGVLIDSGTISIDCDVLQITSSDPNIQIANSNTTKIFSLNNNPTVNSITSSAIKTDFVSSSNIYSSVISGNVFGTFNGIYSGSGNSIDAGTIPNTSLQNNFININNNRVELGSSVQVSGISNISSSNSNIITQLTGDTAVISLNTVLDVPYIETDYISSSQFIGDGSGLTNINIGNLQSISNLIPVDEQNIIFDDGILSLSQSVNIQNIFSVSGIISNLQVYSISGSGFGLTNLNANNLVNTSSFINSIVSNIPTSPIREFTTNISFSQGDVVCLTSAGLQKANNSSKDLANPIGVVTQINGNKIFVQNSGIVQFKNSISNQTTGSIVYLGQNADGVLYADIPINSYAIELGVITELNKVEIKFNKLWKIK